VTDRGIRIRPEPTPQEAEAIRQALAALGMLEAGAAAPAPGRPPAGRP
jgi:hypothetical protein